MTFDSILSLVAFMFSSTSLVLLYAERQRSRKTEMTMRMYEIWTSEAMRVHRSNAWDMMDQLERSESTVKWPEAEKSIRRCLSPVRHFAGDVEALADADRLDIGLAVTLFGTTLRNHLQRMEDVIELDSPDYLTIAMKKLNKAFSDYGDASRRRQG